MILLVWRRIHACRSRVRRGLVCWNDEYTELCLLHRAVRWAPDKYPCIWPWWSCKWPMEGIWSFCGTRDECGIHCQFATDFVLCQELQDSQSHQIDEDDQAHSSHHGDIDHLLATGVCFPTASFVFSMASVMFQHPVKMLRVKDECLSCSIGEIRMPDDFLLKQLFNILLLLFLVYSMFAVVAVQAYGTTKYGYRTGPTANFDTWPMVSKRIPFQKKPFLP